MPESARGALVTPSDYRGISPEMVQHRLVLGEDEDPALGFVQLLKLRPRDWREQDEPTVLVWYFQPPGIIWAFWLNADFLKLAGAIVGGCERKAPEEEKSPEEWKAHLLRSLSGSKIVRTQLFDARALQEIVDRRHLE